jgi:KDO2-lipid IV(A) lauroyltransferase
MPETTGTPLQWLEDRAIRGLIGAAMALPFDRRRALMGTAMARLIGPLAGYGQRVQANLRRIYPDMAPAERTRIVRAALDNAGRTIIENYSGTDFGRSLAQTRPTGPGLPALEAAHDEGRPVLFVTGHFGNHEAPRQVLTRLGYRIGGLYKPMRNPYFNAHYIRTMTEMSGPVFPRGPQGTRGFVRHLKSGGMATLLFDVHDREGVPLPFLGHDAMTSTSTAVLALRYDALLIPYFGFRNPDGLSFSIELDTPIPHEDPVAMTMSMTRTLEARIARDPGQWFWVHRRWKGGGRSA